jgi:hypothetical protein
VSDAAMPADSARSNGQGAATWIIDTEDLAKVLQTRPNQGTTSASSRLRARRTSSSSVRCASVQRRNRRRVATTAPKEARARQGDALCC